MMKIALPHQNGSIFMSFGRAGQFIVYDVEGNEIVSSKLVFAHGQNAKGLAALLAEHDVELLLCNQAGSTVTRATHWSRFPVCLSAFIRQKPGTRS